MGRSQSIDRAGPVAGRPADDRGCPILHVDMDAFYASVELRRRPELRGRPVIVGGGSRGVVLSATYEARGFGVRSALPMARALRMCPTAVVVRPDMAAYAAASAGVMAVFRSVTPLVEPLSLDEAFLDVEGARRRLGSAAQVGEWIRARVADEQGITCSVGVAPTKYLAKQRANRQRVQEVDDASCRHHQQAVRFAPGRGQFRQVLRGRHPDRAGDALPVGHPGPDPLADLGRAVADHLHALAAGHDPRRVCPDEPDKSIGAEETFEADVDDPAVVYRELLRLADRTAARLRATGQVGRTVSIKIRFADFTTITRARTLTGGTDVGQEIFATARSLFDGLRLDRARIRLAGVRVDGLGPAGEVLRQISLGARDHGWPEADRAVDRAASRFGVGMVRRASLLRQDAPPIVAGGLPGARSHPVADPEPGRDGGRPGPVGPVAGARSRPVAESSPGRPKPPATIRPSRTGHPGDCPVQQAGSSPVPRPGD